MAKKKPTRRMVIGGVATRMEHVAAIFPRGVHTLAARIEGPAAAAELGHLADVLRTLEDEGVEAAWEALHDQEAPRG